MCIILVLSAIFATVSGAVVQNRGLRVRSSICCFAFFRAAITPSILSTTATHNSPSYSWSSLGLLQIKKSRPPYIMFLKDALACMRLPSFSAMGSCCKRLYLLCLCAFIISMLLGTTTWANINFNTTKALIPLIVATILPSMIEGVLVLAIIKAINNKPLDCESHDPPLHLGCTAPSDPAGPLDQALIHPAFRDYSEGSLNSTRNFSLPRERCLDVMPACNAPASPIPRPYLATDTISRIMNTHRPLPPLPFEPNNAPTPPPHLEVVSDVTIFPLCIQKRDSATSETAVKRSEDVVNIKSDEVLESKPARFNSGPGYPSSMSEAEKIIIGLASEQDIQEVDPKEAYYARERIYNEEGLTKKSHMTRIKECRSTETTRCHDTAGRCKDMMETGASNRVHCDFYQNRQNELGGSTALNANTSNLSTRGPEDTCTSTHFQHYLTLEYLRTEYDCARRRTYRGPISALSGPMIEFNVLHFAGLATDGCTRALGYKLKRWTWIRLQSSNLTSRSCIIHDNQKLWRLSGSLMRLVKIREEFGNGVLAASDRVLGIDLSFCLAQTAHSLNVCSVHPIRLPQTRHITLKNSISGTSFTNLVIAMFSTFIIFSIRDVIHIRLDINNITIAFWWAMLAYAASTPARRARLAQRPNQRFQWLDVHNMAWIELLDCVGNTERARNRRRLNALQAQAEEMILRHREAAAARRWKLSLYLCVCSGKNTSCGSVGDLVREGFGGAQTIVPDRCILKETGSGKFGVIDVLLPFTGRD
ncbi:hypothetical protein KCU97_g66, partial [Aureobasidium melanogenum]